MRRRRGNRPRQSRASRAGAYRGDHQSTRKRALELLRDGIDRCWRCGKPMYSWQKLNWGHVTDLALGGDRQHRALEHARCNLSAGGTLSLQLQNARRKRAAARTSQRW